MHSPFLKIAKVPAPKTCDNNLVALEDADATVSVGKISVADTTFSSAALTGFLGNVSQYNEGRFDSLQLIEDGPETILLQQHLISSGGQFPIGPSVGEAWSFGCKDWNPRVIARHVYSSDDVFLLPAAQATKARCFITGITGAWSSTRNERRLQPFAEIYTAPNGDQRLRVAPGPGQPEDRVGAYASCILIRP